MNNDNFNRRKRNVEQLCAKTRDILLGRDHSIVSEIIRDGMFSEEAVECWVDSLLHGCEPKRYDNLPFIKVYLETVVCYLFSECNEEDQNLRSLYTLLQNSQNNWGLPFADTPFGIMIADAYKNLHFSAVDKDAFAVLQKKAELLREYFDNLDIRKYNLSGVNKYLDEYIVANNLCALSDDEFYHSSYNELHRLMLHARIQIKILAGEQEEQ